MTHDEPLRRFPRRWRASQRLLAQSDDPAIAREALDELSRVGKAGDADVVAAIARCLGPFEVRFAAVYALGHLHTRRAWDALVQVLEDSSADAEVRGLAAEPLALAPRRSEYMGRLMAALSSELPQLRFWAAYALGERRFKSALPGLRELLRDSSVG